MTRALQALNEAEDIGDEKAKPQEPQYRKPTEPVISVPATVPVSKIARAIEIARQKKEETARRVAEERERREEALNNSEPSRDEILTLAEDVINAGHASPEAKAVAKEIHAALVEKHEFIRNIHQTIGVTSEAVRTLGDDVIDRLTGLVAANGILSELLREICAAAGTVRVDEVLPIRQEGGRIKVIRQFVDVGDEEPDQDPLVDLKWLAPAAIKVRARYGRLLTECEEATKRAVAATLNSEQAHARAVELERENRELREANNSLSGIAKAAKPAAPGSPTGYYLKAEDNRWVTKYTGKHECFMTRWAMTNNANLAHSFDFKEQAEEMLQRLQMAKIHRIGLTDRSTLRVITVRYEDHSA